MIPIYHIKRFGVDQQLDIVVEHGPGEVTHVPHLIVHLLVNACMWLCPEPFPMALYNISRELVLINNLIMLVNMDMVRLPMSLFSLSTC